MAPKSREEIEKVVVNAFAMLREVDGKARTEILEAQGWAQLVFQHSSKLNTRLKDYFDWCSGLKEESPGDLLEEIAYLLFQCFEGVGNTRSYQSYAPQHDLVVDGESNAWIYLMHYLHLPISGRTIVVECKNQEDPITDQQFSRLCGILQNKFQDLAHLGVFISHTPATGFPVKGKKKRALSDSRATQALFHAKTSKYVVVVDHEDLVNISKGISFAKILESKIREVEASTGINLEFAENWEEILLPPHLAKHKS
ncbi:MAG: hypothetical protein HY869_22055 [Chloroflexi bacterium]|nr:hypothetical protein [Chloroflexota bacterium]